ncbi:MAG: DNA-3-methyladenine glycosylase 2 family protein [Actinomycetota bacterium]|nr:DNA-3-methyladenine glycosylase 2 family protein [Actinomycetota bacterium]
MTATTETKLRIVPEGPYSLAAAVGFLTGFTPADYGRNGAADATDDAPVLRLALPLVDDEDTCPAVGIAVREDWDGAIVAEAVHAEAVDPDRIRAHAARILSLDVDASGFADAVAGDAEAAGLVSRFAGLRPVCFNSPYEAACWAVLSQRSRRTQAAAARTRLARALGTSHDVAGVTVAAFPAPGVLAGADDLAGVGVGGGTKPQRLREVANAALDGALDPAALRAMDPDEGLAQLMSIPGIGPFSAELILVRGAGHPDVFPAHEPRLRRAMVAAYGIDATDAAGLARIAERWRPFRSWISFLFRNRADADSS